MQLQNWQMTKVFSVVVLMPRTPFTWQAVSKAIAHAVQPHTATCAHMVLRVSGCKRIGLRQQVARVHTLVSVLFFMNSMPVYQHAMCIAAALEDVNDR